MWVVDLASGRSPAFLRFEDLVQEIFDVALLRGARIPRSPSRQRRRGQVVRVAVARRPAALYPCPLCRVGGQANAPTEAARLRRDRSRDFGCDRLHCGVRRCTERRRKDGAGRRMQVEAPRGVARVVPPSPPAQQQLFLAPPCTGDRRLRRNAGGPRPRGCELPGRPARRSERRAAGASSCVSGRRATAGTRASPTGRSPPATAISRASTPGSAPR